MNSYDTNDKHDTRWGLRGSSVVNVVCVVAQRRKETGLGKYLDLIEAAERATRSPVLTMRATDRNTASSVADDGESPTPLSGDREARKLVAAGWKPKIRLGKTIWQRPDTGFWVSQEMALHLMESKCAKEDQRA